MKALEFESRLDERAQITVPPDVASQVPTGSAIRVILLCGATDEDDWRRLGVERFAAAYAAEDAVYEQLINDLPLR